MENNKELVSMGFLSAILLIGQVGMSYLPNIEIVSLLIYIYTQVYRKKVFFIIYVFVFLEGCIYGFGLWWFGYLYIWPVWALAAARLSPQLPAPVLAAACGGFGLSFGLLESLPYLAGGPWAAVSHWTAGIPFDLAHCGGNFLLALFLAKPLLRLLQRLTGRALPR